MARATPSPSVGEPRFILILLASTFLMGSSFVAGKILLTGGVPPMLLVGWRFLGAALATLPLIFLGRTSFLKVLLPPGMDRRQAGIVVVIGLLQTGAVMGLLFAAMQFISASTASILLFTNPILVAFLGWIFLGERLHRTRVGGLVVGVVGVALAIGVGPGLFAEGRVVMGEVIGLLAALCWAAATIVAKRSNLPLNAWSLSFWQMLVGSLALLTYGYVTGERWPDHLTSAQWGWFAWLTVPASTGSFGLWFVALSKGGATRTSGYLFLVPLFTVVLAYVVLGAALTWLQAMGGLLVGFALWLVNREIPIRTLHKRTNELRREDQP
jgi:drug/metabolite transporter (DMT)-like permease